MAVRRHKPINFPATKPAANEIISGEWDFLNGLDVTGGSSLRLYNSTGSDFAEFYHDGVDFNMEFTNTAEVTINAGLNAPFRSRDVAASTSSVANDYGRVIRLIGGVARTFTLDSDPPEDSWLRFDNASGSSWTIACSPSTNLIWADTGGTGNRTLADDGVATAMHRGGGVWIIWGSALLT